MIPIYKKFGSIIEWCNTDELRITSDCLPHCDTKLPYPNMSKDEHKALKKKPYVNGHRVMFTIEYKNMQYVLCFQKDYDWDGASIPFGTRWIIGAKGSPEFLIPSMVHDKLCENHHFINDDRYLSSLVLKELLLASGVHPVKCSTMFHAVDNFQKVAGGW